eukprot:COSAG02_NODE_243_length_27457_cov_16.852328_5_plen_106_part_00
MRLHLVEQVLSIDPEVESMAMRRLRLAAVAVIYAGKVTLLSGVVKVILKLSLSVPRYSWVTSYAPIFACCFWDTLIFSVAMERVNLVAAVRGRCLVAMNNKPPFD